MCAQQPTSRESVDDRNKTTEGGDGSEYSPPLYNDGRVSKQLGGVISTVSSLKASHYLRCKASRTVDSRQFPVNVNREYLMIALVTAVSWELTTFAVDHLRRQRLDRDTMTQQQSLPTRILSLGCCDLLEGFHQRPANDIARKQGLPMMKIRMTYKIGVFPTLKAK